MRHIESQVLQEETASEQGSVVGGHSEAGRRAVVPPRANATNTDASPMYSFNLSFEELSTAGLDEPRPGNAVWMVSWLPVLLARQETRSLSVVCVSSGWRSPHRQHDQPELTGVF